MENLDTGKDKIKRICEILKTETLQPAREEAQKILEQAEQEARNIISNAEKKGDELLKSAKNRITKEQEIFENSIRQACQQGIESLRQDIETKLFNSGLSEWLGKYSSDVDVMAKLINVLVGAIEKEGTSVDFSAIVPSQVPAESVNHLLLKSAVEKLREHSVVIGKFGGGVQLKLHDKKLTLDLSDEALKELIGEYVRKDFREVLFQTRS